MAFTPNTMFEIKISNSTRNNTQHVSGKFGTVAGSVFTSQDCSAGTLCVQNKLSVCEGYSRYNIKNGNDWIFTAAADGKAAYDKGFTDDHTGIFAYDNYNVNQARSTTGNIYNLGFDTLGIGLFAGQRGDFCEIIIGEEYKWAVGSFTTAPTIGTHLYAAINNGKLTPSATIPAGSAVVYFKIVRTEPIIYGGLDYGTGYVLKAQRSEELPQIFITANNTTITVTNQASQTFENGDILNVGDTLTITATAASGYTLASFVVNGTERTSPYVITATATDITVSAFSKIALTKPTVSGSPYTYTGSAITATLNNYDATKMNVTGNSATNVGDYTAIVSLLDSTNYMWADGTITDLSLAWAIQNPTPSTPLTPFVGNETIGGIQFNTNMTTEEVLAVLRTLTYDEGDTGCLYSTTDGSYIMRISYDTEEGEYAAIEIETGGLKSEVFCTDEGGWEITSPGKKVFGSQVAITTLSDTAGNTAKWNGIIAGKITD